MIIFLKKFLWNGANVIKFMFCKSCLGCYLQSGGLWARVEEISDLKFASNIKHFCLDKLYKQKVYLGPMGFIKICRVKRNFWSIDVPTDGSRFMKKLLLLS